LKTIERKVIFVQSWPVYPTVVLNQQFVCRIYVISELSFKSGFDLLSKKLPSVLIGYILAYNWTLLFLLYFTCIY